MTGFLKSLTFKEWLEWKIYFLDTFMLLYTQGKGIPLLYLDLDILNSDSTVGEAALITEVLLFGSPSCSFSAEVNPQS